MTLKINSKIASCGGKLLKCTHDSEATKTAMNVSVYVPKQFYAATKTSKKIPTLYFLAGLTCTPDNGSEKAFWQLQADKYGFAVVFPDTSPRGDNVPGDPENSWDFGKGAGFYVNATTEKYKENYNMYDYVHLELPQLLQKSNDIFEDKIDFSENVSITGHSMGGFGALSGFLKNLGKYKSCSAFAPIVNPSVVPWGTKAFGGYLGEDSKSKWNEYDPCTLLKKNSNPDNKFKILIHVGIADPFLEKQLKPENLIIAAKGTSWENSIDLNIVNGFDHSYYFISTFVPTHAEFHAKHLGLI
ncbi:hypothetical protein ACO0QE_004051 [Hanseniaspora vineae]